MKKVELSLGIGLLLLMILRLFVSYPYSAILITLTSILLGLIYFFLSFLLLNGIKLKHLTKTGAFAGISSLRIIGTICTGIILSFIIIYSLFKFQEWPYGSIGLGLSLQLMAVIVFVTIIKLIRTKKQFYSTLLMRLGIISFLSLTLYFIPDAKLLEIKYRDYPEYIEAEKNLRKDPSNKVLQQKAREERIKMDKS